MSKQPDIIPANILTQLTEFTPGGYIFFSIDADGRPHVIFNFENPAAALALQNHMRHWAGAFERINQNSAYRALAGPPNE